MNVINSSKYKAIALYFEELITFTKNYKSAANWVMGDIKSFLNQRGAEMHEFPVSAEQIGALISLIDSGKVSTTAASQKLFPALLEQPLAEVSVLAQELNLIQESDENQLADFIKKAFEQHPTEFERFKGGEQQLTGFFMGAIMKISGGKADPKATNQLLRKLAQEA